MKSRYPTIASDDPTYRAARQVLAKARAKLRSYDGVIAVGVGVKETAGEVTGQVCIRIAVKEKRPRSQLRRDQLLPETIDGILIDVVEMEVPKTDEGDWRPSTIVWPVMEGGIAISLRERGVYIENGERHARAGTLGMVVFDKVTREDVLLTNWHVACLDGTCNPGEAVSQPGRESFAHCTVGYVYRWVRPPTGDAAIVRLSGHRFAHQLVKFIGRPRAIEEAHIGQELRKVGFETDTAGQVICTDWSGEIDNDGTTLEYEHQLLIQGPAPLSHSGDSGSVWMASLWRAIGLHFAGGGGAYAYATPIANIAGALQIDASHVLAQQDRIAIEHALS